MPRRAVSSISSEPCVEATVGGLSTLAVVPEGELVRDRDLRRLLMIVAQEAAAAAGLDPRGTARMAAKRCRRSPHRRHPWQGALRARRRTGAEAVFGPLLRAARRSPAPKLALIAEVLRRLDRKR